MKIKLMLAVLLTAMVGCSEDKLKVIHNNDRVSDLELRMQLNEQLDSIQSDLIGQNSSAISALDVRVSSLESDLSSLQGDLNAEIAARQQGDADLQSLLDQESAAREAGDQDLANALDAQAQAQSITNNHLQSQISLLQAAAAAQSVVNLIVQGQIASINSKFGPINSKLTSLQSSVNGLNSDLSSLQGQVASLSTTVSTQGQTLAAATGNISTLQSQVATLTTRLDAEGVKVYRCNQAGSEERFFKINGKYYGAMNQVTTEVVKVVTSSSATVFTNPTLCLKDEKAKLPGGNGQCPSGWTSSGGNTVTVPSYSTADKTVVTSVQISLEELLSGVSYVTTDGTAPCYFNGNGTNLVPAQ